MPRTPRRLIERSAGIQSALDNTHTRIDETLARHADQIEQRTSGIRSVLDTSNNKIGETLASHIIALEERASGIRSVLDDDSNKIGQTLASHIGALEERASGIRALLDGSNGRISETLGSHTGAIDERAATIRATLSESDTRIGDTLNAHASAARRAHRRHPGCHGTGQLPRIGQTLDNRASAISDRTVALQAVLQDSADVLAKGVREATAVPSTSARRPCRTRWRWAWTMCASRWSRALRWLRAALRDKISEAASSLTG